MRKLILFLMFFYSTISFSQQSEWANWVRLSCFQGLEVSCKSYGYISAINSYSWNVRVKNNYSVRVSIPFHYLIGGEKIGVGLVVIDPGEIFTHTPLYVKNDSNNWRVEVESIGFAKEGGGYCGGYCDNGAPNIKDDCKLINSENIAVSQQTPSNQNQNDSNDINDILNQKFKKIEDLCIELSKTNTQSSICHKITSDYMTGLTGTESQINNRKYIILSEINSDIYQLESLLQIENEKQSKSEFIQEEVQQKVIIQQQEKFNNSIKNGDNAFSSKQYDNAMTYYNSAKSFAQNSTESSLAQNKYNQALEAKKNVERDERVKKQKDIDKQEDIASAGLIGVTAGAMGLLNDSYSYKWYAMKFQAGLGYESLPIYSNNVNQNHVNNSYIESFTPFTFHVGFKSGFFNNKGISFVLNPQFNVGFSAFEPGTSAAYTEYGSMATLYFSRKSYSKFKVFIEGGYLKRDGGFDFDYDAANDGATSTDDIREGLYNYAVMKYGGGVMFHWINDGKETYIRPAVFYERASFFESNTKPVLKFNLEVNITSSIIFDFSYVKNYFISGEAFYPGTFEPENKNYFSIKIIRQGKLF